MLVVSGRRSSKEALAQGRSELFAWGLASRCQPGAGAGRWHSVQAAQPATLSQQALQLGLSLLCLIGVAVNVMQQAEVFIVGDPFICWVLGSPGAAVMGCDRQSDRQTNTCSVISV